MTQKVEQTREFAAIPFSVDFCNNSADAKNCLDPLSIPRLAAKIVCKNRSRNDQAGPGLQRDCHEFDDVSFLQPNRIFLVKTRYDDASVGQRTSQLEDASPYIKIEDTLTNHR